jgi:hypothetical protein
VGHVFNPDICIRPFSFSWNIPSSLYHDFARLPFPTTTTTTISEWFQTVPNLN